jgi:hypothetical protein
MAQQPKDDSSITVPPKDETSDMERTRVRSSNDRDQAMEQAGETSRHNRGYDQTARNENLESIDPDSAEADIDRDDGGTE